MSTENGHRLDTSALGALLRNAIDDMDARLDSGRYRPGGNVWHDNTTLGATITGGEPERCEICLAGATFARYGVSHELNVHDPAGIGGETTEWFHALDLCRKCAVSEALETWAAGHGEALDEEQVGAGEEAQQRVESARMAYWLRHGQGPELLHTWVGEERAFYVEMATILEALRL